MSEITITSDHTYYFATDSCNWEVEAATADEAAHEYARSEGIRGVRTAAALEAYIEKVGGYGLMRDETTGQTIFDVPC
jgi:hypothetical protein